jgi:hypothetical protein
MLYPMMEQYRRWAHVLQMQGTLQAILKPSNQVPILQGSKLQTTLILSRHDNQRTAL